MNEATWQYVREHAGEDVRRLALTDSRQPDVDKTMALQQIAGWQKARHKLPSWAATQSILYPPHLNMEQSSSEATALYKAEVAWRIYREQGEAAPDKTSGLATTLIDLTGGLGVDFSFMARKFQRAIYVEQNQLLCDLARHNLPLLLLPHAEVVCADAETFLSSPTLEEAPEGGVFLFLDPARRNDAGQRTYAISDCRPDVLRLLPRMMAKASTVMMKLSPMLDWHKAVDDVSAAIASDAAEDDHRHTGHVAEVHCVATEGECKELLLVVRRGRPMRPLHIVCAEGDRRFCFDLRGETAPRAMATPLPPTEGMTLLVPGAATMKAGCFRELEEAFGVHQIATNSHLFLLSDKPTSGLAEMQSVDDWPGRAFRIQAVTGMSKREIAPLGVYRANVAVRNFPMTAEELRKKLKIKDGGEVYVFATTLENKQRVLLWCSKFLNLL